MEGDFISSEALKSGKLDVETKNSSTSTTASMELTLSTRQGRKINCIIAAAIYMNGDVSIVRGGLGHDNVSIAYNTVNDKPDTLFVLIQSYLDREEFVLTGNAISKSRVTLLYDELRSWVEANKANDSEAIPTVLRQNKP